MKKMLCLILIGFFSLQLFAAEVEIVERNVTIHIFDDGRVVKHVYERIKMKGFTGLRRAGEWFYTYNPDLEEVNIIKSITHTPDGDVVSAPKNAILDFSPYSTENAPDFSNIREKIVSHTALEPGAIVEFEYEIRDKVPHRFSVFELFRQIYPVKKETVTVIAPKGMRVFYNNVEKSDNVYTAKNLGRLSVNREGEPFYNNACYVAIVIKNPFNYFKSYINSFSNKDFKDVEKLLNISELSGMQRFFALKDFITNRINTINLKGENYNFKVRDFKTIVKSGYATRLEKSVLSYWFLKNSNLKPVFLLKGYVKRSIPLTIHGYGVKVKDCVLNFGGKDFPSFSLDGYRVFTPNMKAKLVIDASEKDGKLSGKFFYEGSSTINYSLSGFSSNSESILERKGDFVVKNGKVSGELKDSITLSDWIGNFLRFPIRYTPSLKYLSNPYSVDLSEKIIITLKDGRDILFHNKIVKNRIGLSYVKVRKDGNKVVIERELKIKPVILKGKDIHFYNDLITPFESVSYRTIIFE